MNDLMALGAVQNVPLSSLTSMRVGGEAAFVLRISDEERFASALAVCKASGLPCTLIGNGTNVLARDKGYSGLVLVFDKPHFEAEFNGTFVRASAGEQLTSLTKRCVKANLSGLERLCGIPGTVGGACAMNAGAYGGEIGDVLRRVRVFKDGAFCDIEVSSTDLGYRKSRFAYPECIVFEAVFELKEDEGTARQVMEDCLKKRRSKQPLEYPSAGSTFKRPEGHFAGELIERCGLKGARIGGASVSYKHAGFIINDKNASADDVYKLIDYVQKTVFEKTGVLLEREVKDI
ncbi:MAG: UDP-N-acetylmuramate dehydrogenase [Clostridia bacterium]|nr:UDP-N-acetylmuramate dehydrogenase [Clostridia bacterium]